MSQDKEREIQLQFLEEAQEYLDRIESTLLGLSGSHIDAQEMDSVLRAAHSVKGGAGMMGYQTLSQLAHRLEDSFKVMKAQRNSLEIDPELESLLLSAVDRLRQVLTLNRASRDVDEQWVATVGNPVFDQLHERLGDPVADDAATMLGAEDGTNVAALLFETEVEGCLGRLEGVLDDPQAPCLGEELEIMAQELGGLGEMLQLPAFSQLCESVLENLATAPEAVRDIAREALSAWRRSQALVLVGQTTSLPTSLSLSFAPTPVEATAAPILEDSFSSTWEEAALTTWSEEELVADISDSEPISFPIELEPTLDEFTQVDPAIPSKSAAEFNIADLDFTHPSQEEVEEEIWQGQESALQFDIDTHESEPTLPSFTPDESPEETLTVSTRKNAPLKREVQAVPSLGAYGENTREAADIRWREVKSGEARTTPQPETQENTVRLPVRQLDRLNELFGELTIERNGLGLHLGRLRNLIETLSRRVSTLEQSNMRLRTTYDTVATQAVLGETLLRGLGPIKQEGGQGGQDPSNSAHSASPQNPIWASSSPTSIPSDSTLPLGQRFDALEMDRYSDLHLLSMEVMETIVQIQEVTSDIGLSLDDTDSTARELNQTSKQLQTQLTRLRMRPLSDLVGRYSRALRDLSLQHGKLVELKVVGKGTLIDRSILEAISDPLMHLVRNSFDHGLEDPTTRSSQGKPEAGTIEIKAAHRGNQTIITVSDDGKGIDLNKIRARAEAMGLDAELLAAASEDDLLSLIFEPGFSTADRVTDLSGRGVGMDVVRNNLKSIRGDIRVDTTPGRGTTFTLTVPFTLSVARVLLVESNGMLLAFPTDVIEEMLLLNSEQVLTAPGSEVLKWEGEMVPLTRLGGWLSFSCPRRVATPEGVPSISSPTVLMVSLGEQLHGIQVDRCWGEQEVAIRQVSGPLTMPPGFASCTILGDGKVVPLVDTASLLRWVASERSATPRSTTLPPLDWGAGLSGGVEEVESGGMSANSLSDEGPPISPGTHPSISQPSIPAPIAQKDTILVVDDSINVRRFLALALEKAGYLVEQAKDGQDAVEKLLGGSTVCAVICDIEMPRLDGYGFLARIKSDPAYEQLPIAMLTSRTGDKHRQLAMTLGASAYFSKPYNERELLTTLKTIIAESRERKPIPSGTR
jgi:chemosensory pili system protein ChpA (sensor histidine kinase/response regulator)